jgi:hypothetical protein
MRVYEAYNYFMEWVNSNGARTIGIKTIGHMNRDQIQN